MNFVYLLLNLNYKQNKSRKIAVVTYRNKDLYCVKNVSIFVQIIHLKVVISAKGL
jgi:hypothetical protein